MTKIFNNVIILVVNIIGLLLDNVFSGCFDNGFVNAK